MGVVDANSRKKSHITHSIIYFILALIAEGLNIAYISLPYLRVVFFFLVAVFLSGAALRIIIAIFSVEQEKSALSEMRDELKVTLVSSNTYENNQHQYFRDSLKVD